MGGGELWTGSADGMKWSFVAAGPGNRVAIPLAEVVGPGRELDVRDRRRLPA
jgi:hypothetical protein